MASAEIAAWCRAARFVGPARLDGHRLAFTRRSIRWGGGAADVVGAHGEAVWGALYEVPARALDGLDAKEGEGWAYRRVPVEVLAAGRQVGAETYEVVAKEPRELAPTPEYLALLVGGARERGLPADWVARLDALACRSGPG